ncbi:MAG: PAS domain-containing protein, partial [Desulfobulbaceae bacterium]|nr:PAS domain-containing protein [Desulfobulbaceae bacterium]
SNNMLVAGCDVGALTTKAAVMRDDVILGVEVVRSRAKAVQSAFDVMDKLLARLALSYEQIDAIMETLPFEVTFVDAEDTVAYFNKLDKTKLFPRTRSVIGRKVEKCHPEKSVDTVRQIVSGFKDRTMDHAEFWIDFKGDKILIRYYPVYSETGDYMGVLEVTQEIGAIQKIEGEKRLIY